MQKTQGTVTKMRVTKRHLRRIIREEVLVERGTGDPALRQEEQALTRAVEQFADKYMMKMAMNPSDPADLQRVRKTIDDMVGAVIEVL